ncbi:MAG TPA: alpha/beta hydrolase [Tepidisphaeraceae bacterium]|nr:alpha/beta hydrolase [Tepidisphaeraceae bacterium]
MRWLLRIFIASLAATLLGCSRNTELISPPTMLLISDGRTRFDAMPPELRDPPMQIIYAADRDIVKKTALGIEYGAGRSGKLVFGVAQVGFNRDLSWPEMQAMSRTEARPRPRVAVEMKQLTEMGIICIPLEEMEVREGRYRVPADKMALINAGRDALHGQIREQLRLSPEKDVYLYVHGFNNSFEDAIFRLAMFYHYAGRPGVAIAYTWPAGRGGLFGYAYDRESGEFTVFHLKKFIEAVASCPEVERLHIIGHSRGTDVVCTALRELNIEIRAKDLRTQEQLKLENLVLAAPDLDSHVFEQRVAIEDLHLAARRMTVYLSRTDMALAFSKWLFGGGSRLGNLTPEKFTPDARAKLAALKNFSLIDCQVSGWGTSHDYAFAHPAVVSDLILLLRDDKAPGAANGRPLTPTFEGVWRIENDYLLTPVAESAPNSLPATQNSP